MTSLPFVRAVDIHLQSGDVNIGRSRFSSDSKADVAALQVGEKYFSIDGIIIVTARAVTNKIPSERSTPGVCVQTNTGVGPNFRALKFQCVGKSLAETASSRTLHSLTTLVQTSRLVSLSGHIRLMVVYGVTL